MKRFARFWWDFVVGDDWIVAAGVAISLSATALVRTWWLLPLTATAVLWISLRRAVR